jgi:hypothetical protein
MAFGARKLAEMGAMRIWLALYRRRELLVAAAVAAEAGGRFGELGKAPRMTLCATDAARDMPVDQETASCAWCGRLHLRGRLQHGGYRSGGCGAQQDDPDRVFHVVS